MMPYYLVTIFLKAFWGEFWVQKAQPGTSYPLKYHKSLSCSHVSTLSRRKETSGSAATPTLIFKL